MTDLIDIWYSPAVPEPAEALARRLLAIGLSANLRPHRNAQTHPETSAQCIVVTLTPSEVSGTWIDTQWLRNIYAPAVASGVPVLPVRAADCVIPETLSHLSFADFTNRDRENEEHRLLRAVATAVGADLPERQSPQESPSLAPNIPVRLRHGSSIFPLDAARQAFLERERPAIQSAIHGELGIWMPQATVVADDDLPDRTFAIDVYEVEEGRHHLPHDKIYVGASPADLATFGLNGQPQLDEMTGHAFAWVDNIHRESLLRTRALVLDEPEWIGRCLAAVLYRRAGSFLDDQLVAAMLAQLATQHPLLVETTVPDVVSLQQLTEILRRLIFEGVSIGNLRRILLAISDHGRYENAPMVLADYVRSHLKTQITQTYLYDAGYLVVVLLHPEIEGEIEQALVVAQNGTWLELDECMRQLLVKRLTEMMETVGAGAIPPLILLPTALRAPVRRLIQARFPRLYTIAYEDLEPTVNIQPVGRVERHAFVPRSGVRRQNPLEIPAGSGRP